MNTIRLTTLVLLFFTFGTTAITANQVAIKKMKKVVVYYPKSKQIHYEGLQVNGNKEGLWTYYTTDGYKSKTTNYVQGKKYGSEKRYIKNVVVADENFENDIPHGTQRYYTSEGLPTAHYYFNQGIPDSARFFNNGSYQYHKHETYKDKQVIEVRNYNTSGRLLSVERYRNNLKHGVWLVYSGRLADSLPKRIINYSENKRNGSAIERYNRNGIYRETKGNFVNDTLEGPLVVRENGRIVLECQYVKGKLDGAYRSYHMNEIVEEIFFVSGVRTGVCTVYDSLTRNVISRSYYTGRKNFNNADIADSLFEYHPNGTLKHADWYRYNVDQRYTVRSFVEKDSNGLLLSSGQFKDDAPDGKWKEFHPNGKPKSVINYRDGLAHGPCEFRNDKGVLLLRYTANEGVVNTWPEVWDYTGRTVSNKDPEYADLVYRYNKTDVRFAKLDDVVLPAVEMQENYATQVVEEGPHYGVADNSQPPPPPPDYKNKGGTTKLRPADCFPGGDTALNRWIRQQLVYPAADLAFGHRGSVLITFKLHADGNVQDADVLSCSNPKAIGLQNEALRLMYMLPWEMPDSAKGSVVDLKVTVDF